MLFRSRMESCGLAWLVEWRPRSPEMGAAFGGKECISERRDVHMRKLGQLAFSVFTVGVASHARFRMLG